MIPYRPAYAPASRSLGQAPMISAPQFVAAASLNPPTPVIDTVFAGYEGLPGALASAALLAITGSAASCTLARSPACRLGLDFQP